jgi:hypothetical protein
VKFTVVQLPQGQDLLDHLTRYEDLDYVLTRDFTGTILVRPLAPESEQDRDCAGHLELDGETLAKLNELLGTQTILLDPKFDLPQNQHNQMTLMTAPVLSETDYRLNGPYVARKMSDTSSGGEEYSVHPVFRVLKDTYKAFSSSVRPKYDDANTFVSLNWGKQQEGQTRQIYLPSKHYSGHMDDPNMTLWGMRCGIKGGSGPPYMWVCMYAPADACRQPGPLWHPHVRRFSRVRRVGRDQDRKRCCGRPSSREGRERGREDDDGRVSITAYSPTSPSPSPSQTDSYQTRNRK